MFGPQEYNQVCSFFQEKDPAIHQILIKHGYLKPLPHRNLFSHLVGAIIGQRIRFSQARRLRGKLYTILGTDNFTPQNIIDLGYDQLVKLGISENISQLLMVVSQFCLETPLSTIEDVKNLKEIKGIGNWTINNCLIIYSLQEDESDFTDYLLVEDLIIRRGLKKLYGPLTPSELKNKIKLWSPYCGIVTWYLWKEFT